MMTFGNCTIDVINSFVKMTIEVCNWELESHVILNVSRTKIHI